MIENLIGSKIKQIRFDNDLTQTEFSEKLYASQGYISGIENGIYKPSQKFLTLVKILFNVPNDYFDVTPNELVGRTNQKGKQNEFNS